MQRRASDQPESFRFLSPLICCSTSDWWLLCTPHVMIDPIYYLDYRDSVKNNLCVGLANSVGRVKNIFKPRKELEKKKMHLFLFCFSDVWFCPVNFLGSSFLVLCVCVWRCVERSCFCSTEASGWSELKHTSLWFQKESVKPHDLAQKLASVPQVSFKIVLRMPPLNVIKGFLLFFCKLNFVEENFFLCDLYQLNNLKTILRTRSVSWSLKPEIQ